MLKIRAEARQRHEWKMFAAVRGDLYNRWKKEGAPDAEQLDPLIHNPMATQKEREEWAKKHKRRRRRNET